MRVQIHTEQRRDATTNHLASPHLTSVLVSTFREASSDLFIIPVALNTFTDDILDTFAGIGVGTRRWKREFAEYRPWKSIEQFERGIRKYVRA